MQIIENEQVIFVDCDDTLVMWDDTFRQPGDNKIEVFDPNDSSNNYLTPNEKHIDLVKKHKGRGYFVVVWSAAGYAWANSVVNAVKLNDYVDIVMSKPVKYMDDLTANEILGTRVYLK